MYESFFGLNGLPFKITPDDRIFFGGAQRQEVLDALIYTVERGEGLITVIGEVGTGKTTIARVLAKRLPDGVRIASIYMPNVQPLDMLYMIAQELGLTIPPNQAKYAVLESLRAYLIAQYTQGQRTLLLIDEAQSMPLETLEELRLLSNMQTDDFKLLQIMLFGQQELQQILNLPGVRQVKDRIVYHLDLNPFSLEELAAYLEFRMRMVGYRGERFFSDDVVQAMHQATKGFPRAVNKLADNVLMSAFADQSSVVLLRHVSTPVDAVSIQIREHETQLVKLIKSSLPIQAGLALLGLFVIILLFSLLFSSDKAITKVADDHQSNIAAPQTRPSSLPLSVSPVLPVISQEAEPVPAVQGEDNESVTKSNDASMLLSSSSQQMPVGVSTPEVRMNVKHYPLSYWQDNHRKTLQRLTDSTAADRYSLQLMSSPWRLRDEFSVIASSVNNRLPSNPTFLIDYVLSDGRARIALLYGVYNSREEAQATLDRLPDFATSFAPVVVALKSVSKQMSASTALQMEP
jgi:type II secretory pathway predicted ATPase ExeA